ncbi:MULTISPECIES: hypothetical protein [unclassified Nocardioides]|uniref:hypothetical protein n=1 Tax=unclassified Nocardioides TaxID=2615069 RepID=UPI00070325F5|nr:MULTISPECIES: hypothetical protein [unclassified Nocardioides]KRC53367.1 hypothetical protein ASE19_13530 [Nocardioides sp. Root79]KRC70704.1 hypothetical protein ASE20_12375 [Nocardioides sp. Root240]
MGTHLIGAYGLHWKRSEVDWFPGNGYNWQMLGRIGSVRPGLRICDFRYAAGVYVLEKGGRPVYAGVATGKGGFGDRLRPHTKDGTKNWTHFSWFSFDDVLLDEPRKTYPAYPSNWAMVDIREELTKTQMKPVLGELEALLVNLIYDGRLVSNIQRPRFPHAKEWTQVTLGNFGAPGICHRVDPALFAKPGWLVKPPAKLSER